LLLFAAPTSTTTTTITTTTATTTTTKWYRLNWGYGKTATQESLWFHILIPVNFVTTSQFTVACISQQSLQSAQN